MDKLQKLEETTAKEDRPWWEVDLSDDGSDALVSNGLPPSAKPNTDQSAMSTNHEISSNSDGKSSGPRTPEGLELNMDNLQKLEETTAEECSPGKVDLSDEGSDALASNGFPPSAKPNTDQSAMSTIHEISPNSDGRSGGPKTQQGKERSKHNALKHGIFSKVVLLDGEPQFEFDFMLNGLQDAFEPGGTLEEILVDKIAALIWRHRRLIITERGQVGGPADLLLGNHAKFCQQPLDLLIRYESSLERAFDRALNQLERLQRIRKGQPVLPTLDVNVTT